MSSRRLLLDGSDLPELVRRAEKLGGQVVRAQRLRKGLLGRRWYEVTVEVPDDDAQVIRLPGRRRPPPAGPARPPPVSAGVARVAAKARPAGIDDLLAAAEAAEAAERADRSVTADARASRAASSRQRGGR